MSPFENTDPWRKFKAEHVEYSRHGLVMRLTALVMFSLCGVLAGGVIGALFNPRESGQSQIDNLLTDSVANITTRAWIGAGIGALLTCVVTIMVWRELRMQIKRPPRPERGIYD